jgi:beta-fructofuranosidase
MNDPNGLLFLDGELHVTYQHNPDQPRWGRMHWGYARSRDLVTWHHLPVVLSPSIDGPDAAGCWSGCIVEADGGSVAFYTGVELVGEVRKQTICRADRGDPRDGPWRTWPRNPIVAAPPAGIAIDLFRDPFVFRSAEGWLMLVGAGTVDGHGAVLRYESDDLASWRYDGVILASDQVDPAAGADAPMWECPQLVRTDAADLLIVSVVDRAPGIRPSHVTAFIGRLGSEGFEVESVQQLGMGPDFYAPAACRAPDGRWLLLGWIPEDPPDTGSDRGWAGALTFPRVVSLDGGHLSLSLAAEVARTRRQGSRAGPTLLAPDGPALSLTLPPGPVEVRLRIEPRGNAEAVVELCDDDASPLARLTWRGFDRLLTVARRGIVSVAGRSSVSSVAMPAADGTTATIRMIVDGSILELETNGHTMATARLSPQGSSDRTVVLSAIDGPVRIVEVDIWPLVGPDARPDGAGGTGGTGD